MTIFNTGYSSLQYEPVAGWKRLWPLTRMEFLKMFKTKRRVLVYVGCVAYIVVKLVLLWAQLGPESADLRRGLEMMERVSPGMSPFHVKFYMNYSTDLGFLPFILMTCLVSVRAISADKEVNALEIYWTRGITSWGYFLGKWMGSLLVLGSAFFAGPLVMWLYGLISAPDSLYFERTIEFMPQVLFALALKCVILSFIAVCFSTFGSTANVATFLWLLMILGTKALGEILAEIARETTRHNPEYVDDSPIWFQAICPWDAMKRIEEHITGLARVSDYPPWIAWAFLGGISLFLMTRLRKQLSTTEAIA